MVGDLNARLTFIYATVLSGKSFHCRLWSEISTPASPSYKRLSCLRTVLIVVFGWRSQRPPHLNIRYRLVGEQFAQTLQHLLLVLLLCLVGGSLVSLPLLCLLYFLDTEEWSHDSRGLTRAVHPHSFFADPDPAVFLNADLDPGAKINVDPDSA